jgi:nucleotidyltransferase/DNA polymerase involved in DNA repair
MESRKEWILHVDGDAFFASVEVSRRPDLFNSPVVVGEERGIATALTYSAKALGVKRGDPIFKIKKEYPTVAILTSHFELYRKFSKNLSLIVSPQVDSFETYSIDECFALIVATETEVKEKVIKIKHEVQRKLGITYSFGVARTKTLAKVASKRNKPDGICFLFNKEDEETALKTTQAKDIWGIGYASAKKLYLRKIRTAYEFSRLDIKSVLRDSATPLYQTQEELLGKKIFEVGRDNVHQKTLQSTRTFIKKTNDLKTILSELSRNVENACRELYESGLYTDRFMFYIKKKDKNYKSIIQDIHLPAFTQNPSLILKSIEQEFDKSESRLPGIYRSSGIVLLNLHSEENLPTDLFNTQIESLETENGLLNTIDYVRRRFGFGAIQLARSLDANERRGIESDKRDAKDNYEYGLPYPFLGVVS